MRGAAIRRLKKVRAPKAAAAYQEERPIAKQEAMRRHRADPAKRQRVAEDLELRARVHCTYCNGLVFIALLGG